MPASLRAFPLRHGLVVVVATLVCVNAMTARDTLDPAAVKGQRDLVQIQGVHRTWFCGACFERGGSHEDALRTGVRVAEALGGSLPWR